MVWILFSMDLPAGLTIEGLKTKARHSLSLSDFSKGNGGNCELKGSSNMLFKGISHYFEANFESLFLSYFFAWAFCLCYFLRFLQLCAAHKWMCREKTWWFCDTSLNVDRTQGVFQSGDGCSAAAHLCSLPIHWNDHMAMLPLCFHLAARTGAARAPHIKNAIEDGRQIQSQNDRYDMIFVKTFT